MTVRSSIADFSIGALAQVQDVHQDPRTQVPEAERAKAGNIVPDQPVGTKLRMTLAAFASEVCKKGII